MDSLEGHYFQTFNPAKRLILFLITINRFYRTLANEFLIVPAYNIKAAVLKAFIPGKGMEWCTYQVLLLAVVVFLSGCLTGGGVRQR